MVDEQTGRVVDTKHTGRGYELSKGHYVPIDDDELKAVEIETTHTVDITGFVPPSCPIRPRCGPNATRSKRPASRGGRTSPS